MMDPAKSIPRETTAIDEDFNLEEFFSDVPEPELSDSSDLDYPSALRCYENSDDWFTDTAETEWNIFSPESSLEYYSVKNIESNDYNFSSDEIWNEDFGLSDLFHDNTQASYATFLPAEVQTVPLVESAIAADDGSVASASPLQVIPAEKTDKKRKFSEAATSESAAMRRFVYPVTSKADGSWLSVRQVLQEINNIVSQKARKVIPSTPPSPNSIPYLMSTSTVPVVELTRLQTIGNGSIIVMRTK